MGELWQPGAGERVQRLDEILTRVETSPVSHGVAGGQCVRRVQRSLLHHDLGFFTFI